ncbi:MAG: sulfurtransferase [Ignavibacteriae bacterium]|nr:sulfurtransferase [Ignavibacteriota bacterium]
MELSEKYLKLVSEAKAKINEIDINFVRKLINDKENFLLIDIREESEWENNRIPGAIYLGKGIIEREIESVAPNNDTQIVLYCGGGYRSALSAENLQRMGYKNVYSMIGGITEWEEKDFPLNTEAPSKT